MFGPIPRRSLACWPDCRIAAAIVTGANGQDRVPHPGWLRYTDGNAVSGVSLQSEAGGGLFRSDCFGDIRYRDSEARSKPLNPLTIPAKAEPPQLADGPPDPSPDPSRPEPARPVPSRIASASPPRPWPSPAAAERQP